MPRFTSPPPWWRRVLHAIWRVLRFTFKVLFILLMVVIPIPIAMSRYQPHRERRNHAAQVLKKE